MNFLLFLSNSRKGFKININHLLLAHTLLRASKLSTKEIIRYLLVAYSTHRLGGYYYKTLSIKDLTYMQVLSFLISPYPPPGFSPAPAPHSPCRHCAYTSFRSDLHPWLWRRSIYLNSLCCPMSQLLVQRICLIPSGFISLKVHFTFIPCHFWGILWSIFIQHWPSPFHGWRQQVITCTMNKPHFQKYSRSCT